MGEGRVDFASAYNARWLTPEEVAKAFVEPNLPATMLDRGNSLLIGPRGSGKTTLLKMLDLRAIDALPNYEELVGGRPQFLAVFIPTDFSYLGYHHSSVTADIGRDVLDAFLTKAFNVHIAIRFVETVIYAMNRDADATNDADRLELERRAERDVAVTVGSAWGLELSVQSLEGIVEALKREMIDLSATLPLLEDDPDRLEEVAPKFLASYVTLLDAMVDAISRRGVAPSHWGLLFDELELAPDPISKALFGQLRSLSDRFILKLAVTPFPPVSVETDQTTADRGHDYTAIGTTSGKKIEARPFAVSLAAKTLLGSSERGAASLAEVLGHSLIGSHSTFDALEREALFRSVLQKDRSFESYLERRRLWNFRADGFRETARPSDIRKVAPVVMLRDQFRSASDRQQTRSRKRTDLWTGYPTAVDLLEANPRFITGVFSALREEYEQRGSVSPSSQTDALDMAADFLQARARTKKATDSDLTLEDLYMRVGEWFRFEAIRSDFRPEPPASFVVDDSVPDEIVVLVEDGVNLGVFVHVQKGGWGAAEVMPTARLRRFRLNYLLAPRFQILPRLGPSVELGTILRGPAQPDPPSDPEELGAPVHQYSWELP